MSATKYLRGACKCCCNLGGVIPFYQNVTKVRPAGDTLPANYTSAPYPRDQQSANCNPPAVIGDCGNWLVGGDLNGLSAQVITDTVNDIGTCGSTFTSDHNCYNQNGTVNMKTSKLFGGQWINARKQWHGALPWDANEMCSPVNPALPPTQNRYLTFSVNATWDYEDNTSNPPDYNFTEILSSSGSYSGSNTVNSKTGIRTTGPLTMYQLDQRYYNDGLDPWTKNINTNVTNGTGYINGYQDATGTNDPGTPVGPNYLITYGGSEPTYEIPMHSVEDFYCGGMGPLMASYFSGGFTIITYDANGTPRNNHFSAVGTATNWSISGSASDTNGSGSVAIVFNVSATQVYYSIYYTQSTWGILSGGPGETETITYRASFTGTLSNPYTATDCYTDFINALNQWDMSDMNLGNFRTDGELANAPVILYDELTATIPDMVYQFTMDDYRGSPTSGIWPQTPYLDPYSFQWIASDGSVNNIPGPGHCSMSPPLRTGAILAHNPAGSDRHFWFDYADYEVDSPCPSGTGHTWSIHYLGGSSDPLLPAVTMRWLDKLDAQYDGLNGCGSSFTPSVGNFPYAWWDQTGNKITGGKYVCATQTWDAINPGRPCGPDKYAIDQTLVGCVTATTVVQNPNAVVTGTFTVSQNTAGTSVWNSTTPPPASGLVMVAGAYAPGLYQVTGVTGTGPWTISVSSIVDGSDFGVPTGWQMSTVAGNFIGWLRFPTAPGICGRAPITTSYSSPTLTINTASQPYLRAGLTGSILVDLYDTNMTLLASSVSLTRVNDGQFTATITGAPATNPYPTAAYIVAAGVTWTTFNPAIHNRTGVFLDWSFNQRLQHVPGYVPNSGYAGVDGCTGCAATQFNYTPARCIAVVGIVPFASQSAAGSQTPSGSGSPPPSVPLENFPNQVLFPMPETVTFDVAYGAHWQGMIALTMQDPLYQAPFNPFCGGTTSWEVDDGTGKSNTTTPPLVDYFPSPPLVEATTSSAGLPSGIYSTYDTSHNQISPQMYPHGIPVGNISSGAYGSILTDWVFASNACATITAGGNFSTIYSTFVYC